MPLAQQPFDTATTQPKLSLGVVPTCTTPSGSPTIWATAALTPKPNRNVALIAAMRVAIRVEWRGFSRNFSTVLSHITGTIGSDLQHKQSPSAHFCGRQQPTSATAAVPWHIQTRIETANGTTAAAWATHCLNVLGRTPTVKTGACPRTRGQSGGNRWSDGQTRDVLPRTIRPRSSRLPFACT